MFFFEKILLHAIFSILCGKCFILLLQSKRSLLSSLSSLLFSLLYYKAKSNLFKEDLNSASPAFSTNFSAVFCTCSNVSILLSNSLARKIFSPRESIRARILSAVIKSAISFSRFSTESQLNADAMVVKLNAENGLVY